MPRPISQSHQLRKAAREKAGLSEKQAARIAGVKLSTFLYYERGGKVSYYRADRLAMGYGCRIEIFMRGVQQTA